MQTLLIPIDETDDIYNISSINYSFDGLKNGEDYVLQLEGETQSPNGGSGMSILKQDNFNVQYDELKLKLKPELIILDEQGASELDWSDLIQNPGVISEDFNYIKNFILYNNTALSLGKTSALTYTATIPSTFTQTFMEKIPLDYDGMIFETSDGQYQFGYNNSKQQFYTIIQGKTSWSNLIKITQNPFFFTLLPNEVIIRQYNIYKKLSNMKGFKLNSMSGYPLKFMMQENN